MFMTKVSLQTAKSENFILVMHHWGINPDQDAHQNSTKMLKRNDGMQYIKKYEGISTWFQHIPIHNLSPLEKNRKSE